MLGSTFIRIYFHVYVYLFEYFNSRIINITPASMCSCPCCRILVMIPNRYVCTRLYSCYGRTQIYSFILLFVFI